MQKILMIEDEKAIAELLKYSLEREGFAVDVAFTGKEGLKKIERNAFDLILLDLMLPDIDGLVICKTITLEKNIPIIIVSAKNDQIDKLIGLEYGADDYITKPFDVREVVLRVKNILRRIEKTKNGEQEALQILRSGSLCLDMVKHEVTNKGERVELTPKEFSLLEMLMRNKGKVLTRGFLLEKVWEFEYVGDTRTVDIHIQRLRKKLNDNTIVTVFGVGYKIPEDLPQ